jgi:tripeptidyl-peptidase-1
MFALSLLLAALSTVQALPALTVEVESMSALRRPAGWSSKGRAARDQLLELTFAVKQANTVQLTAALMTAADPDSPSYGEWLSNEAVHALVKPARESTDAVRSFLVEHGLAADCATPNCDFITSSVTVVQAEALLGAEYQAFEHTSGHVVHRTPSYRLPAEVAAHVDFVSPTVQLSAVRARPMAPEQLAAGDGAGGNTPDSLRKLYNATGVTGAASKKTKQAVTAFLKQLYSASDIAKFYKKLWPSGSAAAVKQVGDAKPGRGGIESMLDIEYSTAMGGAVATEFWGFTGTAPDNKENEPFLKWLTTVASTADADVPQLFSTSYGEDEDSVTPAYANRIVIEFQKCGARGISLLFASGDSGAARDSGGCHKTGPIFNPQWPAGSPWVTGVGATEPYRGPDADAAVGDSTAESAAGLSSGGFSARWRRAAWQDAAVAAYLASPECPDKSYFNATGAGFPDISAQGVDFAVFADGSMNDGVSGTSCAAPTAAGVISLVNDHRLANGKKALGFLNPLIYKSPAGFNDITTGAGGGCRKGGKEVQGVLCDKPAARGASAYVLRARGSLGLYRISIGSIYIYRS